MTLIVALDFHLLHNALLDVAVSEAFRTLIGLFTDISFPEMNGPYQKCDGSRIAKGLTNPELTVIAVVVVVNL